MQDLFTRSEGNDVLPIPSTHSTLIQNTKKKLRKETLTNTLPEFGYTLALSGIREAHLKLSSTKELWAMNMETWLN